jgi:hypothetical protein
MTTPAASSGGKAELDPRDHCDRLREQTIFGELMKFQSVGRLLTFSDVGDSGKSSLLRRLEHNCAEQIKPPVPRCRVELNLLGQAEESALAQRPFGFVHYLVDHFAHRIDKPQNLFPSFHALNAAREAGNFGPFRQGGAAAAQPGIAVTGTSTVENNEGQSIGVKNVDMEIHGGTFSIHQAGPLGLLPHQEKLAQERCIEAFFADLRTTCAQRPLAILLDGWDRCDRDLQDWIRDEMLGRNVFHPDPARRPDQLLVVIAGRPHGYDETRGQHPRGLRPDEFSGLFDSSQEFSQAVCRIEGLSREWDDKAVRGFLRNLGYDQPDAEDLEVIQSKMRKGRPPGKLKTLVRSLQDSEAS